MYKLGGILADDMGLGKTLQVISVLRAEAKSKVHTTSIVVCPSTLVLNWKSEVEKWCNTMKVLVLSGKIENRREKLEKKFARGSEICTNRNTNRKFSCRIMVNI